MRADAERNRRKIMEAALEAVAQDGAYVPMEAIAKRAGVGIGTFYRHFPTREDLLNALLVPWADEVEQKCERVIADNSDPHDLLLSWLTEYVACVRVYKSCTVGLVTAMGDPTSPMRPKCDVLIASTERVLAAAGPAVHADMDGLSLNRLAGGVAIVADLGDLDHNEITVMLDRIVDGVLAPEPSGKGRASAT